jgi:NAD(P)H-nitrite reductase large subunit
MKQVDRDLFAGPDRQRLVVIGNGMVGARFVEELLGAAAATATTS